MNTRELVNDAADVSDMESGRNVNFYLDAESIAIATKLGNGNISSGIRQALQKAKNYGQKEFPI